jgi:glutamate--cysteine ligase
VAASRLQNPELTPSARVLAALQDQHDNSFLDFGRTQSLQTQERILALPWTEKQQARGAALAQKSFADQKAIELSENQSFEDFRQDYVSAARLSL